MFSYHETVKKNKQKYLKSLEEVLDSGTGILGPKVKELEDNLSKFTGSKYVYCCQSGTSALTLALTALDIKPGDEIITTPFSWISTVSTIVDKGATPVFVDIIEDDFTMDITKIEEYITEKTKCILFVNIFGKLIKNIDLLHSLKNKYNLFIIEDAAQSFGAYNDKFKSCDGEIADISCTSFYPTKPLAGFGDGGACFTNCDVLAEKIKLLRNHGLSSYGETKYLGLNARMNEFQAAIININLEQFEDNLNKRLEIGKYYNENLNSDFIKPKINIGDVLAQYCLLTKNRDELKKYLKINNIPFKIFYHKSLADQNIFKKYKKEELSICQKICNEIISIPCYSTIDLKEINSICKILNFKLNSE